MAMSNSSSLIATILLTAVCGASGAYCPPQSPQAGGMRDIMLIYAAPGQWRSENFLPYVAYLDRAGKPCGWFYDAYLFLMYGGAPSGKPYIDGATDQKDWTFYLDEEFAPDREFAALDRAVDEAAHRMGRDAPSVPVIAMIPYPSRKQKAFGDLDGDGTSEDFSIDKNRIKAVNGFLHDFLARWEAAHFRHLKLWGFYWMNEGIGPSDEAVVKAAAGQIHALGCKFHWIPWFNAPGVEKWRELGFDFAIMQPNYAFIPPAGLMRVPDENRLTTAANICRRLGLGIEMELDMKIGMGAASTIAVPLRSRLNLQLYLDHGDDALDGYQSGAVRAYYQGNQAVAGLCYSRDPALRRLYDDLYRFHCGTYERRRPYQPWQASDACLTDGRWRTRPDVKAASVRLTDPHAVVQIPLARPSLVGDVRVHFAGKTAPRQVTLMLMPATGNPAPVEAAALDDVVLNPEDGGGFGVLTFPLRLAQSLALSFDLPSGDPVEVDEILLMPADHLLSGCPYRLDDGADDPSQCLTDGLTGGAATAVWRNGRGRFHAVLPDTWYADSLFVFFRPVDDRRFAPRVSADGGKTFTAAERDGVAMVPLDRPVHEQTLVFEDAEAGAVAVDEVALVPAKNLAADCAYRYDPPFRAKYPDTGSRELTDGEVSKGFGDGRSVGWASWAQARRVTVTVDLGAAHAFEQVETHLQGGGYAAVDFPERVAVSVAEDGVSWRQIAVSRGEPAEKEICMADGRAAALGWLRLPTPNARGRYVRLIFQPKGWLMLGEIRVVSGGADAALNRPYSLRPQPTGEARYADNAGLLTDGYYVKAGTSWKSCAGFDTDDPTVTVDLGRICRTGAARVHLQGGGPGGVYFPEQLTVDTSADGTAWVSAGETSEHPTETAKRAEAGFMGVTFAPRDARFVRFRLKRRGWVMLDEIEVFPDRSGQNSSLH